MKKIFVLSVFISAIQIGFGQDASLKSDAKKVIVASGAVAQIEVTKKNILKMVPETKQGEFEKEFNASMSTYFDLIADAYIKEFTHEEIKEMLKFYESPVGKKITSKAGIITEKTMEAAHIWSSELEGIMKKYLQQ